MSDPTFSRQFGLAVQADILRQAATDRRRRQARSQQRGDRRAWLVASARRLAGMFRAPAPRRGDRGTLQAGTTNPCPSWSRPTSPVDDR